LFSQEALNIITVEDYFVGVTAGGVSAAGGLIVPWIFKILLPLGSFVSTVTVLVNAPVLLVS
jgi:hypothetical protein